jgi:hypothetical protein
MAKEINNMLESQKYFIYLSKSYSYWTNQQSEIKNNIGFRGFWVFKDW